jgi:hypothetical protein
MAHFASDSAIPVPAGSALEKSIQDCQSVSEIQNVLHAEAARLRLIERDPLDRSTGETIGDYFSHHVVAPGTVPRRFATAVTIDGIKHILETGTEEELRAKETELYRAALAAPAATTQQTDTARDARGRFVAQPTAEEAAATDAEQARLAQLEVSFRLGQITAADYIKQSGAVDSYLSENGVSVEALQKVSDVVYTDRWAAAAAEFIVDHPDWQGGAGNQKVISDIVVEQKWEDEDPRAAIEKAYQIALQEGRLVANPELTQRDEIGKAQTFDEIKQAVGYHGPDGSSFWGR